MIDKTNLSLYLQKYSNIQHFLIGFFFSLILFSNYIFGNANLYVDVKEILNHTIILSPSEDRPELSPDTNNQEEQNSTSQPNMLPTYSRYRFYH